MSKHSDYFELVCKSVNCFTEEDNFLAGEFSKLMQIVLRDGIVDDRERDLLEAIIEKAKMAGLSAEAQGLLKQVQTQYAIAKEK